MEQHSSEGRSEDEDGLTSEDLRKQLLEEPPGNADEVAPRPVEASDALAPYLSVPLDFSEEAYKKWLDRVCEQPDDAD